MHTLRLNELLTNDFVNPQSAKQKLQQTTFYFLHVFFEENKA